MRLLYEDLTYTVRGCIFDVYNILGTGLDEECYHIALVERLKELDIPFQSKVPKYVVHRGKRVHKFIIDLIIDEQVILELKHISTDFIPLNYLQIISYLKCWEKDLGLLVNFGLPSAAIKRIVYTEKKWQLYEDYDSILDLIRPEDKVTLRRIRAAILDVVEIHGLGYHESVYQAILLEEFEYKNIDYVPQKYIPIYFRENIIREFELKYPFIADKILCGIVAIKDETFLDAARIKTYLKKMNLDYGLLIHFGKNKLEIIGISSK